MVNTSAAGHKKPTISRLSRLFTRKKKSYHIPDDLCTDPVVTAQSRAQQPEKSLARILETPETPVYTDHKADDYTGALDDRRIKAAVHVKLIETETQTQVTTKTSDTQDFFSSFANDPIICDAARTVHSDMLELISEALMRSKESQIEVSLEHARSLCPPIKTSSGVPMGSRSLSEGAAFPGHSQMASTLDETITSAVSIPRRPVRHLRRSFSAMAGSRSAVPEMNKVNREYEYLRQPLPLRPPSSSTNPYFPEMKSRKVRIKMSKKDLVRASLSGREKPTTDGLARRDSCPCTSIDGEVPGTSPVATQTRQSPNVNHLLGVTLFFYWISAGRRFFDESSAQKLRTPGAKCLCIEHSIIGFQTEFPHASLDVYKVSTNGFDPSRGRYTSIPFEDNTFDVISARALGISVLAAEWTDTLRELKRILKPGGQLEFAGFSTAWVNAGPAMQRQQKLYAQSLAKTGFAAEIYDMLPEALQKAAFSQVSLVHLAIPVYWGGRVSGVWRRYYEPLRKYREQQALCYFSAEECNQVINESISHRATRAAVLVLITK